MSLYPENEKTASVYHATDSNSTKKTSYSGTASFTILMFVIRRDEDKAALLGDEIGDYVADVNGTYTNAGNIRNGDKIVWEGTAYTVINSPRHNTLFNRYKLLLKEVD
jgi:hypothetical protein